MSNLQPERPAIEAAHEDGRHASEHPIDKGYWVRIGCSLCAATHDRTGQRLAESVTR